MRVAEKIRGQIAGTLYQPSYIYHILQKVVLSGTCKLSCKDIKPLMEEIGELGIFFFFFFFWHEHDSKRLVSKSALATFSL
jgi:hypothetical protein